MGVASRVIQIQKWNMRYEARDPVFVVMRHYKLHESAPDFFTVNRPAGSVFGGQSEHTVFGWE
jgi:hypothetical protein